MTMDRNALVILTEEFDHLDDLIPLIWRMYAQWCDGEVALLCRRGKIFCVRPPTEAELKMNEKEATSHSATCPYPGWARECTKAMPGDVMIPLYGGHIKEYAGTFPPLLAKYKEKYRENDPATPSLRSATRDKKGSRGKNDECNG